MNTFKIDTETKDLVFDANKNIELITDGHEQAQSIERLLTTSTDEYFLNPILGLSYKYLQVKSPDLNRIKAEILKTLYQETRIKSINNLSVNFDNKKRTLSVNFNITMYDGTNIISSETPTSTLLQNSNIVPILTAITLLI